MMKNLQKMLILAVAMTGISTVSFAQASSATATTTATASATIITPITITKINDMSFGNVVATTAGGTVILSPASARTESGVQLPTVTGTVTAASFTVTGESGYAYTVTLPAENYVIATTGGEPEDQMTLTNFLSDAKATIVGGTQTLNIGATLHLVANQASGTYIGATPLNISVNYN